MTRVRFAAFDWLGVGLVGAFAAWSVVSAAVQRGNPFPQIALLAATAATYAIGRLLGRRYAVPTAKVVALAVLAAALVSGLHAYLDGPLASLLGYGNANGALLAQGVAAASMVAVLAKRTSEQWLFGGLALVLFGLTVYSTSQAASVLAVGILLAALTARWLGYLFAQVAPLFVIAAVAITIIVGATHDSPVLPAVEQAFTARRAVLWQEAMGFFAREPLLGIGPGMFAEFSPTAAVDADARWAHSAYLQTAAETGILGVLLLGSLLVWTYGALYRSRQDPRLVVIGAAATTAFAVHAAIDYIAHYAVVTLAAALLTGLASSRSAVAEGSPASWPAVAVK